VDSKLSSLNTLERKITRCSLCSRLVAYRAQVSEEKKRIYSGWDYWGKPVPGFGSPEARLLIVGLAPAAHGSNRTGRMFTGDLPNGASVWLMRSLFKNGFANQPESLHRNDGLRLISAWMTAAVRCAPPANKPLREEFVNCSNYLHQEIQLLKSVRVIVPLGIQAFDAVLKAFASLGASLPRPKPKFGHGKRISLPDMPTILCCYHTSRQNTNTGRLSEAGLDNIFNEARSFV